MYIYITAYVNIYMMEFCSVVFSELLFFNAGDFCTENLSLGAFIFYFVFFPQVRTNRAFVIQTHRRMIWREDREEEKKRSEVRRGIPKQVTRLHSTVPHVHPSV